MALLARVDKDVCISSGKCVADAQGSFEFDADEIAQAVDGAAALDRARLIAIARTCPSGAISVTEDGVPLNLD
ncbi:MAG TPA: (4Fe-4S)-binding protein [Streptosporangiaceae bacterium]|nr:(4Fe-4S)-binding protein [Streptosporangiaceae bacterium]